MKPFFPLCLLQALPVFLVASFYMSCAYASDDWVGELGETAPRQTMIGKFFSSIVRSNISGAVGIAGGESAERAARASKNVYSIFDDAFDRFTSGASAITADMSADDANAWNKGDLAFEVRMSRREVRMASSMLPSVVSRALTYISGASRGLEMLQEKIFNPTSSLPNDADQPSQDDTTTALPRRGSSSGSELFQKAITQAEQEERDRPARERLAKARADEQERLASIKADADARAYEEKQARKSEQDSRETREALGALLGVVVQIQQGKADRKQARNEEQHRLLQAQQEQRRKAQEQQNNAYAAEAARAEAFNRESARAASTSNNSSRPEPATNGKSGYQLQMEQRVAEGNKSAQDQEEKYRIQREKDQARIDAARKAQAEEDRYYAPLACVQQRSRSYGNAPRACWLNNCGRTVEYHWSGGMWSVVANDCFFMTDMRQLTAACERNDFFDKNRNQCKRP